MAEFISSKDFQEALQTKNPAIGWGELPINVIYKVDEITSRTTKFGTKTILLLTNKEGESYRVWACSILHEELSNRNSGGGGGGGVEEKKECIFIKPLGMRTSNTNSDRKYQQYEIVYR